MAEAAATIEEPKARAITARLETVYLVTAQGVEELVNKEGDRIRDLIKKDTAYSPLDFRHFDDDRHTWATWAVLQPDGNSVKPLVFPDPSEYGLTPPELFTKAVTYPSLISQVVTLLRNQKQSLWDKMMKPATVIIAIVVILMVMGMFMVSAQG